MKKSFSCYIISETSLGLQCAIELVKEGNQLLGIISTHHETCRWAKQNNVTVFASLLEFQELNPYKQFDYLFSIVNSQILPNSILHLPRFCAINYHNGPLPRYAGVNATSWAILNQEKTHGITWHEMINQVDAGDIIRQAIFPINEDDTALTLNLCCYEYAIREFKSLLYDIGYNKIDKIPQDLSKRSFYVSKKKPFGGGIIDWKQDISYLKRLSRALDFGSYPNLLSKLKVLLPNNEVLYPVSLDCLTQNDEHHKNQIGEIINLNPRELVISCANGLIRIKDLYTRDGRKVLSEDLNTLYGIKQGDCLPVFGKESLQYFTDYLALSDGDRRYWQDRLQGIERLEFPWNKNTRITKTKNKSKSIVKRIEFIKKKKEKELIAYILIYLSKLAQSNKISFNYIDSDTAQQIVKSKGLCIGKIINATISPRDTIKDVIANIANQVALTKSDNRLIADVAYELSYNGNIEIILDIKHSSNKNRYTKLNSKDIRFVLDKKHKYIDVIVTAQQASRILDSIANHIFKLVNEYTEKDLLGNITLNTKEDLIKLQGWNETNYAYPKDKTIHQLFEESVQRTPDRIAITYEDQQISYSLLNKKANQLAHYLISQGVSLETPVAISMPRSPDLIIGLLAILKSGGTYVPIDPEYPTERIHYMLGDSKALILLTTTAIKDSLDLNNSLNLGNVNTTALQNITCLDEESLIQILKSGQATNPNIQIPPDSLCYIIYTSGSTGRPKGVGASITSVINRLIWGWKHYPITDSVTCCLQSSICFVDSTWDIFGNLLVSSRLIMYASKSSKDIRAIINQSRTQNITRITLVPALIKEMIQFKISNHKINHLEITGEYFDISLSSELFKTNTSILNFLDCYGATEATSVIYRDFSSSITV